MTMPSSADSSPHDELPHPYGLAVQTILDEPVPEIDLSRLIPAHCDS